MSQSHICILKQILQDENILKMKQYKQHGNINTYLHCKNVMFFSLKLAKICRIKNYKIANIIIGAMLHDFYLYDYHGARRTENGFHAFAHPKIALQNANKLYILNKRQQNIIRSHMFPATLFHVPKYSEAWLVNISDKYCAIHEYISDKIFKKQWEVKLQYE